MPTSAETPYLATSAELHPQLEQERNTVTSRLRPLLAAALTAAFVVAFPTATGAQPATAAEQADSTQPIIFESGRVSLTPKLSSPAANVDTISGLSLGLLDDSSGTADTPWYAADEAILHVPDSSRDDEGNWTTALAGDDGLSVLIDLAIKTSDGDPPLNGYAFDQINSRFGADVVGAGRPNLRLANVTGPDGGTFRAMAGVLEYWSSAALYAGQDQGVNVQVGVRRELRFTFDQPGRYCVTIEERLPTNSHGTLTDRATYTVYVGNLPTEPVTCDPADDWSGEEASENVLFDSGHTDLRVGVRNGELAFGMGSELLHLDRTILSRTPSLTVPEYSDYGDYSAIGAPGSKYWYFPMASTPENYLWPGFSTESVAPGDIASPISFTLNGFTVDGIPNPAGANVIMSDGWEGAANPSRLLFDTARGVTSFDLSANIHMHPAWAFTAEGLYCLSLTAQMKTPAGGWKRDDALLTIAVGDSAAAQANELPTCEQQYPDRATWPSLTSTDLDDDGDGHRFETRQGSAALLAFVASEGEGELSLLSGTGPRYTRSANADGSVIVSTDESYTGARRLRALPISTERAGSGPVTVELGDVRGPGDISLYDAYRRTSMMSMAEEITSVQLAARSRTTTAEWRFSADGVYCVPLTVTDAQGATVTATLTFAIGLDDASGIISCLDGQEPGPVEGGGSEGDPGDEPWNVPHLSRTDSGAVILNDGHIDFSSLLEAGAIPTRIKDTSVSADPTWWEPEETVLQVLPNARTTVPAPEAYRFLGEPGADVWRLDQNQQAGLLWPGWSTESIPVDATLAGVTWTLTGAEAPGDFALFQTDALGRPVVLFTTQDGVDEDDTFEISKNTHAHGSWAFGAEGVYCLDFRRDATRADGADISDSFRLTFAVGKTDVRAVGVSACGSDQVVDPGDGIEPGDGSGGPGPDSEAAPDGGSGNGTSGAEEEGLLALTGGQPLGAWLILGGSLALAGGMFQTLRRRRGEPVSDGSRSSGE